VKRHKLTVVLIPVVVLAVVLIALNGLAATSGAAKDAKGCKGLSDYREEVFALWSNSPSGMGDRKPTSMSSDDWLEIADVALKYQRGLKKIDPPDFAAAWHQALIEDIGLAEQMFLAIADGGLFMALGFEELFDEAEEKLEAAVETGDAMCADFSDFARDYEALGDEDDGTPSPEATPSTAGTPRAG